MPLIVPLGFAQLLAHMMPDQIRMASEFHFDRLTQQEIADKRGISKSTVCRALQAFDETCDLFHVPRPNHDHEPDTRHIRTITPDLMRAL